MFVFFALICFSQSGFQTSAPQQSLAVSCQDDCDIYLFPCSVCIRLFDSPCCERWWKKCTVSDPTLWSDLMSLFHSSSFPLIIGTKNLHSSCMSWQYHWSQPIQRLLSLAIVAALGQFWNRRKNCPWLTEIRKTCEAEQSDPKAAGTISSPIRKSALLRSSSSSQAWMPTFQLLSAVKHASLLSMFADWKDWKWKQNTAERISEFDAKVLKWGSMQSLARSSAASRVTFGATKLRDGCCELNGVTCPIR